MIIAKSSLWILLPSLMSLIILAVISNWCPFFLICCNALLDLLIYSVAALILYLFYISISSLRTFASLCAENLLTGPFHLWKNIIFLIIILGLNGEKTNYQDFWFL